MLQCFLCGAWYHTGSSYGIPCPGLTIIFKSSGLFSCTKSGSDLKGTPNPTAAIISERRYVQFSPTKIGASQGLEIKTNQEQDTVTPEDNRGKIR